MVRLVIIPLLIHFSLSCYGQVPTFIGEKIVTGQSFDQADSFREFSVFKIDIEALNHHTELQNGEFTFRLILGDIFNQTILLQPNDLRSEKYSILESSSTGIKYHPKGKNKTYSGKITGQDEGEVRLTIDHQFLFGFFEMGNETVFIEPFRRFKPNAPDDWFLVYRTADIIDDGKLMCAFTDLKNQSSNIPEISNKNNGFEKSGQECHILEVALASDWLLFEALGSTSDVENFTLGNLNNVQANFDDEFSSHINFEVTTQYISSCDSCDPWTNSTGILILLQSFKNWANSAGFGTTDYDVASLWTNREFSNQNVGLAWTESICEHDRYNVLQSYTNNANRLRVLQAHELGHNFGANHDEAMDFTIMRPSVSVSHQWSESSLNSINNFIQILSENGDCFSACPEPEPPVASIITPVTHVCPGSIVPFIDNSQNNPDSWQWTFEENVINQSQLQNPIISFPEEGEYPVSLIVSNVTGADTLLLQQSIQVDYSGSKYLMFETFESEETDWQILNPDEQISWWRTAVNGSTLGNHAMMINNFDYNNPGQTDALISPSINLEGESDITLSFQYAYARFNESEKDKLNIYISIDGGQTFPHLVYEGDENGTGNFATVPDMQTAFFPFNSTNWCDGPSNNECITIDLNEFAGESNVRIKFENISGSGNNLFIDNISVAGSCQLPPPPTPDFSADITTGCAPLTVNYSDESAGLIDNRVWQFPGGTPAFSIAVNPTVQYLNPGNYNASLILSNPSGMATKIKDQYIEVKSISEAEFSYQTNGLEVAFQSESPEDLAYYWDFGDGENDATSAPVHLFSSEGIHTVSFVVTNECGPDTLIKEIALYQPPNAGFSVDTQSGCTPFEAHFSADLQEASFSYFWKFENGVPAQSTAAEPSVIFSESGTHNVQLIVTNPIGADTVIYENLIAVNEAPEAAFLLNNNIEAATVNCVNNSINHESVLWNFGDGFEISDLNPIHEYSEEGEYTITLIANNECGSDTTYESVTILFPPEAGFTVDEKEGCRPFDIQFNSIDQEDGNEYIWFFEGGSPEQSTNSSPLITYEQPGYFDVRLIVSNAAGADTLDMDNYIFVNEPPVASFSFSTTIGEGGASFMNNTSNFDNLYWNFGDNNSASALNPDHFYENAGDYAVSLIAENECGQDTFSQQITIIYPPEATINPPATQTCIPAEIQFSALPEDDNLFYEWSFEGANNEQSNESAPVVIYNEPGKFDVQLIVSNEAGADTMLMQDYITVNEIPQAGFYYEASENLIQFFNTSQGGESFLWIFDEEQTSTETNPSHIFPTPGIHDIQLIVENDCGSDTISHQINVITNATNNLSIPYSLKVYPNPNSGIFDLEISSGTASDLNISFWNVIGQKIFTERFSVPSGISQKRFNFSNWPAGVYIVKMDLSGQTFTQKVFIDN